MKLFVRSMIVGVMLVVIMLGIPLILPAKYFMGTHRSDKDTPAEVLNA